MYPPACLLASIRQAPPLLLGATRHCHRTASRPRLAARSAAPRVWHRPASPFAFVAAASRGRLAARSLRAFGRNRGGARMPPLFLNDESSVSPILEVFPRTGTGVHRHNAQLPGAAGNLDIETPGR